MQKLQILLADFKFIIVNLSAKVKQQIKLIPTNYEKNHLQRCNARIGSKHTLYFMYRLVLII